MDLFRTSTRPLAGLKASLRHCTAQKRYRHERIRKNPALIDGWDLMIGKNMPPKQGFWQKEAPAAPEPKHKKIKIHNPPVSEALRCPTPTITWNQQQVAALDPLGQRERLFSRSYPEHANVGDVLLVKLRNGDPFVGVCISIKRGIDAAEGRIGADTSILLRNHLTAIGVEMSFKIFSPNVSGIEVVERARKRARRARLYYMRNKKHDRGSLAGVLERYQNERAGITGTGARKVKSKKRR
ncbi:hypothetical protein EJ05DRAFT_504525 [Pseudovirgaria hyperparasitica]|uniref:Mitochondrial ribosomal protein-like protein n=1 Tax=Pseudovirgaria hyperparasitica TaxID=470096 RepID=A0A6A6VTB7_9PEZI|nr:uncharacterized protein EJ05DRAFT_504525 [Pseudovirgaria hyperparasitica]KAF2753928.1 hypothetical protein EJ05DRAFT_504525 [Pseudovirgaria hyperparasitica]